jgi:hypothetical protein
MKCSSGRPGRELVDKPNQVGWRFEGRKSPHRDRRYHIADVLLARRDRPGFFGLRCSAQNYLRSPVTVCGSSGLAVKTDASDCATLPPIEWPTGYIAAAQ